MPHMEHIPAPYAPCGEMEAATSLVWRWLCWPPPSRLFCARRYRAKLIVHSSNLKLRTAHSESRTRDSCTSTGSYRLGTRLSNEDGEHMWHAGHNSWVWSNYFYSSLIVRGEITTWWQPLRKFIKLSPLIALLKWPLQLLRVTCISDTSLSKYTFI